MSSAFDPRQPNRTRQPAPRPVSSGQRPTQPTQRAAQPAARSAQPLLAPLSPLSVQASSLFVVLLSSLLPIQPSPRAVPALSSRLLPAHAGTGTAITLPRTSCSWLARRCSGHALEL